MKFISHLFENSNCSIQVTEKLEITRDSHFQVEFPVGNGSTRNTYPIYEIMKAGRTKNVALEIDFKMSFQAFE